MVHANESSDRVESILSNLNFVTFREAQVGKEQIRRACRLKSWPHQGHSPLSQTGVPIE